MNKKAVIGIVLMLLGVAVMVTPAYMAYQSDGVDYEYSVKTEQVDASSTSTQLEDLDREVEQMLYEAFRKNDGFLSSSSATVTVDEEIDNFEGWKEIQVSENAVLLVAIDGPTERHVEKDFWVFVTVFSTLIWFPLIYIGSEMLYTGFIRVRKQ